MNKSKCFFMRLALIIGLIVQSALLHASTLIDGLYYDLDTSSRTATVTYEVDGAGNYASLSANVKIPESVVYNGVTFTVTMIGENTFSNCKVLESISIPGTVLQIGQNTGVSNLPFYNCTSLKSVRFEDGASSLVLGSDYRDDRGYNGTGLFSFCPLEEVYIGRNITYIDDRYSFEKYPQYYGYSAFYNQPKLAKVTISSTVTEIPSCFFKGCKALNKVSIQGQLTKIPSYSFDGCQLSVLTLSNSIEEIGDYAFQNNTTLTTASLVDNVKKIGKYAFSGCTKLSILNLGNSLVTIDDYAFQSIGSDANVGLNFEVPNTLSVIGKFAFYKSAVSSINIPNSVTTIGESCFAENTKLEKVTLGNGCSELPENVFSGCSLLSSVVLSNGLETISDAAFSGCKVLESISIPGTVLQIGQNTGVSNLPFYNCTSLKSVRFEDGASSLVLGSDYRDDRGYNGTGLFSFCPLEEVYIGRNITYIDDRYSFEKYPQYYGYSAFYNQPKLAKVTISSTVTEIPAYLFYKNASLTLTSLPKVKKIGASAFQDCSKLTTLNLGQDLQVVGNDAFNGCSNVTKLTFPDATTTIGARAFASCI